MSRKGNQRNDWKPGGQTYRWKQQDEEDETFRAVKTKNEAPKDYKAEMEELVTTFPDEMDKLLEQLDEGELSEAELSIILDSWMARGQRRRRSISNRNEERSDQSENHQGKSTAPEQRQHLRKAVSYTHLTLPTKRIV